MIFDINIENTMAAARMADDEATALALADCRSDAERTFLGVQGNFQDARLALLRSILVSAATQAPKHMVRAALADTVAHAFVHLADLADLAGFDANDALDEFLSMIEQGSKELADSEIGDGLTAGVNVSLTQAGRA